MLCTNNSENVIDCMSLEIVISKKWDSEWYSMTFVVLIVHFASMLYVLDLDRVLCECEVDNSISYEDDVIYCLRCIL